MRAGLVHRAKATGCCRGSSAVVGAPVACVCAIRGPAATIRCVCVADHSSEGRPRCQEVRALAVDAEVERLILGGAPPDRIVLAIAAAGEIKRKPERWSGNGRSSANGHATTPSARRQYDAVEPENRLVARSLERVVTLRLTSSFRRGRQQFRSEWGDAARSAYCNHRKAWSHRLAASFWLQPAKPR